MRLLMTLGCAVLVCFGAWPAMAQPDGLGRKMLQALNDAALAFGVSEIPESETSVAPETVYAAASELQRGRVTALDAVEGLNVDANEVLNDRAVSVMRRMSHKLTGRDGAPGSAIAGAAGGRGGRLSPGAESRAGAAAGEDVENAAPDGIDAQVQRLIVAATSHENLCQSYIGWCPFW